MLMFFATHQNNIVELWRSGLSYAWVDRQIFRGIPITVAAGSSWE